MPALPRPDLAPGPHRDLVDALHDLHHAAGWPSLRSLGEAAGCSRTTVSRVFSSPRLPAWGVLELLVEAMGGDPARFHELWLAAGTPDGTGVTAPDIAGRKDELDVVRAHLETGSGLLLVTGEAGIGKTRLLTEAQRCTPDVLVLQGRCLRLSTEVPLLPIADVLGAAWRSDGGGLLTNALTRCPSYVAPSLARLLPELEEAPGEDGSDRHRLFAAVSEVLSAMASVRPLALVVEDLHWADAATLDLVEHLVDVGTSGPPLVGTYRVEDATTPAPVAEWRLRVQRNASVTALDLGPLTPDGTEHQIRLLTGTSVPPELASRIHARSRGHPLFTEQLVSTGGGDLPRLLADLLDVRIGVLEGAAWSAATALAIVDRPVEETTVGAVADLPSEELVAGLHELRGRLLADVASDGEVALRHPLLGEAIRRRLTSTETVVHHGRAAMALSTSGSGSSAEIAEHWRRAGDRDQELAWTVKAAREADDRFASAEAANLWERVLALWPADQELVDLRDEAAVRRTDAYVGAIRGLKFAGRTERAMVWVDEAEAHLDGLEPADSAELLWWLADSAVDPSKFEMAVDRAIDVLRTLAPSETLVDALVLRAGYLRFREEYAAALEVLREALSMVELIDPQPLALTRGVVATVACFEAGTGDFAAAERSIERATAIETSVPDPGRDTFTAMGLTDLFFKLGRPAVEVEAVAADVLHPPRHWVFRGIDVQYTLGNVVEAWLRAGEPARAEAVLALTDAAELTYDGWTLVKAHADVDIVRGRADDAAATFDALSELSWTQGVPFVLQSRAELALWRGDPLTAVELLAPLFGYADPESADQGTGVIPTTILDPGTVGWLLVLLARAAADAAGAAPQRRIALQETVRDAVKQHPDVFAPGGFPCDRAAHGQFEAERARLHNKDTVDLWVEAARDWDHIQRPHDAAYCRWRAAQLALRGGQGTAAAKLLRRAAHDARQHVPLTAAIDATIAGTGSPQAR
jgi:tetratricopeptide (TPR) repeat protein